MDKKALIDLIDLMIGLTENERKNFAIKWHGLKKQMKWLDKKEVKTK